MKSLMIKMTGKLAQYTRVCNKTFRNMSTLFRQNLSTHSQNSKNSKILKILKIPNIPKIPQIQKIPKSIKMRRSWLSSLYVG